MYKVGSYGMYLIAAVSLLTSAVRVEAVPPEWVQAATSRPAQQPDTAIAGDGYDSLNISLLSRLPISAFPSDSFDANDCWGYVSPSGREYALYGMSHAIGIVDVTNPASPVILGDLPHPPSTWSDMGCLGEYCYAVNESAGGLQVIDMTRVDEGIVAEILEDPPANHFSSSHNLYLNTESEFIFPCGTNPVWGFLAYDLSDPVHPVTDPSWTWMDSYVHDLQVVSYDDCPYAGRSGPCEIAFAFGGGTGFWIVDVTDKSSMTTIAFRQYPNRAYCHQGFTDADRKYIYINDEADELSFGVTSTTYVFDIQDLGNPQYVTSYTNGVHAIDHNLYVLGNFVFAANYASGLRVFDVSNLASVQEVGYFDTSPFNVVNYVGAWSNYPFLPSGIVLVSDMQQGLFILDVMDATGCLMDSHCDDSNECTIDVCGVDGSCGHPGIASGTVCDDGNNCTFDGLCDGDGSCVSTDIATIPCEDGTSCLGYTCNTGTGFCTCEQCFAVEPAAAEEPLMPKNRYLAFNPGNPGTDTALQITFVSLPPPFDVFDGMAMWVDAPHLASENGASAVPIAGYPNFNAATLSCTPAVWDWGSEGTVYLHHPVIIPGGKYVIRTVSGACLAASLPQYSAPLQISTTEVWGDVVDDLTMSPPGPPNDEVTILDVVSIVGGFGTIEGAARKARTDLEPGAPDLVLNISDIMIGLNAFAGLPYPFDPPDPPPPCLVP